MHLLAASLVPLILGPALAALLMRWRGLGRALDAFVLVSVAGLVLLHIFPQALAEAGAYAIVAAVAGATLPLLGGKLFSANPSSVRSASLLAALLGLALHAIVDGVALAPHAHHAHAHHDHDSLLGLAVVLHRIPVGLAIWWLVRPRLGLRVTIVTIVAIAVCTILGFSAAHSLSTWMHGTISGAFQGLVAGSLLHVAVGHSHTASHPHQGPTRWQLASGLGGLLGLASVIALTQTHPILPLSSSSLQAGPTLLILARHSAAAMIVAYLIAALFHTFLPGRLGAWLRRGSTLSQASRGTVVGLPHATCSCAITPLYEGLVRGGAPPAAAIAFMVAAPELSVAAILISVKLLGVEVAASRVLAATFLALLVGMWIGTRLMKAQGPACAHPEPPAAQPWSERIRKGLRFGFVDVPDHTLPWFALGLLGAALLEPLLDPARISQLPPGVDVPLMTMLGLPLYVCATGSTPLAAVLIHKGLSPGAAIAFLLTGPATNLTTFGVLAQLHGKKVALLFGAIVGLGATALGFAANLVLPPSDIVLLNPSTTPSPAWLDTVALALLGLLLLLSLLRQGAHGFVARVVALHGHDHHHHPPDCACVQVDRGTTLPAIAVPKEGGTQPL